MNGRDIRQHYASPYPGLRPFRQDEAELFYGREEQVEAMLVKLETHRFLAVVGSSGCGKSSLVRAGLLPALDEGYLSNAAPPWLIIDLRPGDAPLDRLAQAFLKAQPQPDSPSGPVEHAEAMLAATLRRGPLGLIDALREARVPGETNVLVLVDQFEELFRFREQTHGKSSATEAQRNEAAAFVELLRQTARQTARPVFVVITMRSDFLGDCDAFLGLPEVVNDGQFLAPRLTRNQLGEVIRRPAQLFGATIDEPLVNRLLNQLGNDPDQLPVLQHALMRMWARKQAAVDVPAGALALTAEDYALTGGLDDALSQHADEAYNSLDDTGQRIAERMFRCLSDGGLGDRLTRRLAKIEEIAGVVQATADQVISVVETFRRPDRCFLMPPAHVLLTAQTTLDISHESLLRLWKRIDVWVRAEATSRERFRDLCRRAEQFQSGGDLLGRQDLNRFQTWFDRDHPTPVWSARYGGDYGLSIAFLKKSAEAIDADDERKRRAVNARRYVLTAMMGVLCLFTTVLFVFWQTAVQNAREAKKASIVAEDARSVADRARQQAAASDWDGRLLYANSESERGRYARSSALHMSLIRQLTSDDPRRNALTKYIGSECARLGTCLVHNSPVWQSRFSPDGESVLTVATESGEARTWYATTGKPMSAPMRHDGAIQVASFSPDGTVVATAGTDNTSRIWDSRTGNQVAALSHDKNVITVAFASSGNQVATACDDGILRLWGPRTGEEIGPAVFHDGRIRMIVAQPNGRLLATTCSDGIVRLVDVESSEHESQAIEQPSSPVVAAFSGDGRFLAVGCTDGTVTVWNIETKTQRWDRPVHHHAIVSSISFSSDGSLIATGSNDTTARVWDAETGTAVGEVLKHGGAVRDVIFFEDNQKLLTGCLDNAIRLWDYRSGRQMATPLRHDGPINQLDASPNQDMLISASGDSTARIWKRDWQLKDHVSLPCRDIARTAAFSPSGSLLLTGHNDKSAIVWDANTWNIQHELPHKDFVNCVAFGKDDETIVTGSRDLRFHVWNIQSRPELIHEFLVSAMPSCISVSPDRTAAVIGTLDGNIFELVLNPLAQSLKRLERRHFAWVYGVAFSPSDAIFVTAGSDERLTFWGSRTFEPIGEPTKVEIGVSSIEFSRNGSSVVAGCVDGTIHWFDPLTRQLVAEVFGHEAVVTRCDFNPRGDTLVTGSLDRSVRFWDAESRLASGVPLRHDGEVSLVLFTPEGRKMLTAAYDKTLHLWRLPAPAIDDPEHPDRLQLSVEVRAGCHVDQEGNIVRFKQAEWLERQKKLAAMGGPCDAPTWDEYDSWKNRQAK